MAEYDVFISHAHADKKQFVEELYKSFQKLGVKIFYDTDSIEWGDDWARKIQDGLAKCRFGVIIISKDFYDRTWTEKELKSLLVRQNNDGENVILPVLYNTNIDELKSHCRKACYKDLAKIQFISATEADIKDITILLARKLLSSNRSANAATQKFENNKVLFDKFFEGKGCITFYRWLDELIKSGNQWKEDYDENFIGWHLFNYNGKPIEMIQHQEDETCPYDNYISCQYRINPLYYDDFCKYFDTYIRPQM